METGKSICSYRYLSYYKSIGEVVIMKTRKLCSVIIGICLLTGILSGCSQAKKEAVNVMEDYLNHIISAEYSEAYALLSDFDKGNISEESFIRWREQVAQTIKIEGFSIDSKIDTFKNYKYLGTEFGTAYGLKVDRKQEVLIPDIEQNVYDKESFRIMVQKQENGSRVLLLLTKLDETIAAYDAYLKKLK